MWITIVFDKENRGMTPRELAELYLHLLQSIGNDTGKAILDERSEGGEIWVHIRYSKNAQMLATGMGGTPTFDRRP